LALSEDPDLIQNFENLGLSPNEAKVYLALLENHPITGYQLSKISGILRPVVYEMLNRLVEKGGARIVKSNPDTYSPVEITEFLKNIEMDFTEARKHISDKLESSLSVEDSDFFWNIIGRKNIVNRLIQLIEAAKKEIYVTASKQEFFDPIAEALQKKSSEGVHVDVFSYHELQTGGLTLYSYNLPYDFETDRISKRVVEIVSDRSESLVANFTDDKTAKAVHSKNPAMVKLVSNGILDKIYIYRLWRLVGTEKIKLLVTNDDKKLFESIERHFSRDLF
jgi:sugar-specific transcriptional regulator TrmB